MSSVVLGPRVVPGLPPGGGLAWRLVRRNLVTGRRQWLLILSGLFEPVFYLLGLGIGVGALVGDLAYEGRSVPYREFVAPATAVKTAAETRILSATQESTPPNSSPTPTGVETTP